MISVDDLWLEHKKRLHGYIVKRVHDPDLADDILQEVFAKAYVNLHKVKQSGSLSAWLYRIAANAISDHYRAQHPFDELPNQLPVPETERDTLGELASCLQPLIDGLPEIYRDALMMSEIEGLPHKTLAERLGISLSGAKSRVQRGREKLRQSLHECCDIETGRRGVIGFEPRNKSCQGSCD